MKYPLITICFLAAAVAAVAPAARAGIIQTTPDDFAVFAGGSLSLDRGAAVTGPVGAVGGGYLDRDVRVSQGVYSGSKLTTGRDARIDGGVVSKGNVYLNRGTSVAAVDGGGKVGLGSDVRVGDDVAAGDYVSINRNAAVGGDVSYGTGEWISRSAAVGGEVGRNLRHVRRWQTTLPDEPAWSGGGGDAYFGRGEDVDLAPDTYGSLSVDRGATVRLSAGTYDLGSMWLGRDTEVVADTSGGDVRLNLSGSLSTDSEVTFSKSGDGALLVRADDFIYLGKETQAEAGFTSFRRLDVDKASMISGRIQSTGDVWIGRDAEVRGPMGGHPIPEPAGLAFLAGGLVAVLTGRWIRRD